jgi:hypothetical protein
MRFEESKKGEENDRRVLPGQVESPMKVGGYECVMTLIPSFD